MKNNTYSMRTLVRWMRWIGLSFLFLTGMLNVSNAQVSLLLNPTYGYTFANSSGTYTPLSGGTVFQSGATLNTDANSAAITLPFVFTFNGIKENTIFINNNGYITFALAQTTASNTVPLSTTTTSGYDGAIAGLANNLVAAATGTPEIRYGLNGTGDFVVQYQDLAVSTFTSTRITFQIVLGVDGKTVSIVYGPNNTGQASVSGSQVGLRGTNQQDWNNRTLASGGNWNTSGGAVGTSNTSTMTWTATSTLPTSGRTFTWTPNAYTPTYKASAIGSAEEFTTWINGPGPLNIPGTNWATNGYGNASWQIDNTTASTTGSGWTGTSGAYTPVDYVGASGGHSARFHAFNATSPQVGYLDYYVNLSGCGTANRRVSFYTMLTGSAPNLQVYLSTDGGATFTLQTMSPAFGTNAAWVSRFVDIGSVTSATTIIRFKATSDFGSNDIGLDHVTITLTGVTPPSIAVSPTSGTICAGTPGGVALTASGAGVGGTYSWSPASGLNATTGTNVTATPSVTTIYTVTGTDVNCAQGTATASISVNPQVGAIATATPPDVCFNANSNLLATGSQSFTTPLANTYTFAGSTTTYSSITGTNLGAGAIGDDVGIGNLPIGFTFNYNGSPETVFGASSNGFIQLGNTSPTFTGFSSNALASTAKVIAALWDDNNTTGSTITYATTGSVGFRVLTVQYTAMHVGGSGSSSNPTIDCQIKLYEGSNKIEIIYGSTSGSLSSTSATIGISGASGNYISVTPLSPANTSTTSTSSENSSISTAANFPSGTMYSFTPSGGPAFTYAWSPGTFLSATNVANPTATGVTASTTYTVTVTGTGGCSATATVSVNTTALSAGTITASGTACVGSQSITTTPSGGGTPYSYSWSPGGATTQSILTDPGTITYTVTVTDACLNTATATFTATTNALPSVSVSPGSSMYCSPAGSAIALSASGATTYAWAPASGLNATTGASVNATPAAATTYTVTGTDANGCSATATSSISVSASVSVSNVTGDPNPACSGGNSQLNVAGGTTSSYSVAATTYGLLSGSGTSAVTGDDAASSAISLPFNFSFFGTTYSSVYVHTNGFISFSSGQPTGSPYLETVGTAATPNNYIAICHDDLNVTGGGTVTYFTYGSAPNRVFVIDWSAVKFYNSASNNGDMSGQIQMFENDQHIAVHVTSSNDPTLSAHTIGIENSGGTLGYAAPGRNNVSYSFTNTTPEAWAFYPNGGTLTYSWSPVTDLDNPAISNPLASNLLADVTYTVTVTDASGCSNSGSVLISVGSPLVASATSNFTTVCDGQSVNLTASATGGGSPYSYSWDDPSASTTANVTLVPNPGQSTDYTVTITDACGGSEKATVTIVSNALPSVSVSGGNLICGSGSVSLTGDGANSYSWSPGGSTSNPVTVSPTVTTTYTVTGTDANNCSNTATQTVVVGAAVSVNSVTSSPDPVCQGASASLNASASMASSSYCAPATNNGGTSGDEITAFTSAGMGFAYTNAIQTPTPGYLDKTTIVGNAVAGSTYSISISQQDGSDAARVWLDANNNGSFADPGELLGTSSVGSSVTFSVTIPSGAYNGNLRLRVRNVYTTSNPVANLLSCTTGLSYGVSIDFTLNVTGGVDPLTYAWSPAAGLTPSASVSNPTTPGLTSNTVYTVTATSVDGCTATGTVTANVYDAVGASCSIDNNVTCNGAADGSASVSASGGSGSYSYSWAPSGGAGSTATGLAPGTYTVTVTDALCGTATCSVTITEPAVLSLTCTPTNESSPGSADGSVTIVATGGTAPYSGDGVHGGLTAGTYSYTVTDENGCTASCSATVGTNCVPSTAATSASASATEICSGNNVNLSLTGGSLGTGASWKWYEGGCGAGAVIGTGASITTGAITGAGVHTFYARAEGTCGTTACVSVSVTVTVGPPAGSIAVVSFPASGCVGGTGTITCTSVPNATGYSWSGPSGILFDGQPSPYVSTSTTVTLTYTALPPAGISGWNVCVFAKNACGNSPNTKCSWIRATLSTPTFTSAPVIGCPSTTVVYSVATVDGAASYNWTFTGSASLNGGGTSVTTVGPVVNVTFGAGFTGGTLCVTATTSCGYTGGQRCVSISTAPGLPGAISGSTTICPGASSAYSITPVAGAVSYVWTATGTGVSVVGSGTSATVSTTGAFVSGSVCVAAISSCGASSAQRCKTIGTGKLGTPGNITGDPTTGVCGQTYTYSIPSMSGATGGYTWSLPSGVTGSSSSNSITVTFPPAFSSGTICVHGNNGCGAGPDRCVSVFGNPGTPASLSGNATPCIGFDDVYTWPAVPGATDYILVVPVGYTVISGNPTISNFAVINIGGAAGTIGVKAENACGVSGTRTLSVTPVGCRLAGNQPEVVKALATRVFPNPTNGLLNVEFNSASKDEAYLINVLDLSGRVIMATEGKANEGSNLQVLDLSHLAKGMYMINLKTNEGSQLVRVSVE